MICFRTGIFPRPTKIAAAASTPHFAPSVHQCIYQRLNSAHHLFIPHSPFPSVGKAEKVGGSTVYICWQSSPVGGANSWQLVYTCSLRLLFFRWFTVFVGGTRMSSLSLAAYLTNGLRVVPQTQQHSPPGLWIFIFIDNGEICDFERKEIDIVSSFLSFFSFILLPLSKYEIFYSVDIGKLVSFCTIECF